MDSFNFRLQPVLEHRRRLENRAKQELARAKTAERQAREVLTSMETAFGDGQSDMADARRAEIDASEVAVYQRYLNRLKQDIAEQDGIVSTLHVHSEQRRSEVIDGMKARKVVEKLRSGSIGSTRRRSTATSRSRWTSLRLLGTTARRGRSGLNRRKLGSPA